MATKKAPKALTIPFDRKGNMLSYQAYDTHEMRENYEFTAVLTLTGISRGRSAANAEFVDENGRSYSMFLKDFSELLRTVGVIRGKTYGRWTFVKRGANYGVKRVSAPPPIPEDVAILGVALLGAEPGSISHAAAFVDCATEAIHAG